mmetsp:Transcript_25516/g.55461  ORF Transcript_25516/g.55461 Transcript_25516/m.55461 type:complete len:203 (-) Transcript_25516:2126-2734(-)
MRSSSSELLSSSVSSAWRGRLEGRAAVSAVLPVAVSPDIVCSSIPLPVASKPGRSLRRWLFREELSAAAMAAAACAACSRSLRSLFKTRFASFSLFTYASTSLFSPAFFCNSAVSSACANITLLSRAPCLSRFAASRDRSSFCAHISSPVISSLGAKANSVPTSGDDSLFKCSSSDSVVAREAASIEKALSEYPALGVPLLS